jgi:hypothetical protein
LCHSDLKYFQQVDNNFQCNGIKMPSQLQ